MHINNTPDTSLIGAYEKDNDFLQDWKLPKDVSLESSHINGI